jgi:hypothetical protein
MMMSISPLAKIPLAILFALAFKRTITSPNPPAAENETFVKGGLNRSWYLTHVPIWAPVCGRSSFYNFIFA